MKRIIAVIVAVLICMHGIAQIPGPVTVKPGQKPLPRNLKVVTKANLSISALSLLSATGGNDRWDIKLAVTIKNSGGLKTPECKIRAMAQNAAAASNPWKELAIFDLPALNPGGSLTREYHILDKAWIMHKIPVFNLKLEADYGNHVDESSESDNESAVIRISDTQ